MPNENTEISYIYRPIGPLLEMGLLENVFGDTNGCVRKSAFDAVGGCNPYGMPSHGDWDLWALLCLKGYTLDVIPEPLFHYRYHEKGYSKRSSWVINHQTVLWTYLQHADKLSMQTIIENLLVPFHYQNHPAKVNDE